MEDGWLKKWNDIMEARDKEYIRQLFGECRKEWTPEEMVAISELNYFLKHFDNFKSAMEKMFEVNKKFISSYEEVKATNNPEGG